VRIEQARGSFVQEAVIDHRVHKCTSFSENIAALRDRTGAHRCALVSQITAVSLRSDA
jgi:DNA-binding GntR family transcriptional regulator